MKSLNLKNTALKYADIENTDPAYSSSWLLLLLFPGVLELAHLK